jgi:hypothetical protein
MSAPLAQPAEVAGQDPFMNIAAKLSSMSKQINMAGSGPLGERSVNIPSAGVVVSVHQTSQQWMNISSELLC